MINWKNIADLHVIKKFSKILPKWFGVELFYTDEHARNQSNLFEKQKDISSVLLRNQLQSSGGHEFFSRDVEHALEKIQSGEASQIFEASIKGLHGMVHTLKVDDQVLGAVFAYPFLKEDVSAQELESIRAQLLEIGFDEEGADLSLSKLKKVSEESLQQLQDLLATISEEIRSFHLEIEKREERILALNSELGTKYRYHSMIGRSKKMQQIYLLLQKIAKSESTVLVQGENGTGKELVAKAIHYSSPRKNNIFLAQNCSAFNDNLLDSELFGHAKGAFTGAVRDKKGLFEIANGGTLFLDEIGDTTPSMQVKLLRVLQEGTFLPVGSVTPKKVNVRVIAATNKNIKAMIAAGEFREDLYYRINVINLNLPSLKERKEDISLLVEHFLEERCAEMGFPTKRLSGKCLEKLYDYSWPGNVRELQNEIERLVVLAGEEKTITPDLLSPKIVESIKPKSLQGIRTTGTLKEALEEVEYHMIREGLKRCDNNKSKLAKELGISRAGLIMKVEKYQLGKRKEAVNE